METHGSDKAFFAIQPVDQVLAHRPAFPTQHDLEASAAVTDTGLNDLPPALAKFEARVSNARLALGGTVLARQGTGPSPRFLGGASAVDRPIPLVYMSWIQGLQIN
jgi:hypothetical protein